MTHLYKAGVHTLGWEGDRVHSPPSPLGDTPAGAAITVDTAPSGRLAPDVNVPTLDVGQLLAAEAGPQEQLYEQMSWLDEQLSRMSERQSLMNEQRLRRQVL